MIYYIPIAGTGGMFDEWVVNERGIFSQFMATHDLYPYRTPDGGFFDWDSKIDGLWWGRTRRVWLRARDQLLAFSQDIPYQDRNYIAHSHGGQVVLLAAAVGLQVRTLTTIGTPVRRDVPAKQAYLNIQFWQHVYDVDRDWIASMRRTLGQIGDFSLKFDRRFLLPGVQNHGLKDIDHSKMLMDPGCYHKWIEEDLLEKILSGGSNGYTTR